MGSTGRALAFDPVLTPPTCGERLLLTALRSWARARLKGDAPQVVVRPALAAAASERIGALFVAWMESIEATTSRPLQIHCLCSRILSADERRLIACCGLAPVAFEMGRNLLGAMLREPDASMCLARALSGALAAEGWPLPARLVGDASSRPPASPTLH